ncbi:MAG: hypothetical protein ACJ76J_10685, partial [Thermoanaerobaculia bacterium]
MTRHRFWLLALGVLLAQAALGQSPATRELLLNASRLKGLQFPDDMACERGGTCTVVWDDGVFSEDDPPLFLGMRLWATVVSPAGGVVRERILTEDPNTVLPTLASVGQRFAMFWDKNFGRPGERIEHVYQWFGLDLEPRGELVFLPAPPGRFGTVRKTVPIPGGFVQLVSADDGTPTDPSDGTFLMFFDATGRELHPPLRANPEAAGEQRAWNGGLSVDPVTGIITVVYEQFSRDDDDPETDVFYRRFSLDGKPLT